MWKLSPPRLLRGIKEKKYEKGPSTTLGTHIALLLPFLVTGGKHSLPSAAFTALTGLGETLKNM